MRNRRPIDGVARMLIVGAIAAAVGIGLHLMLGPSHMTILITAAAGLAVGSLTSRFLPSTRRLPPTGEEPFT
jgi:hypothetical protein